jgi:CheY-like chemotaxis protein
MSAIGAARVVAWPRVPRPEGAGSSRVRVLVADDQASVRLLICTLLEDAGIETAAAEDGDQVLALAGEWDPDVVVLDWLMPAGGLGLVRQLVAECGLEGRVIMLSALDDPRDRREALVAGVACYMTKPPDLGVLVETLGRIGTRARRAVRGL